MSNPQASVASLPTPSSLPSLVAWCTGQVSVKSRAISTQTGRKWVTVVVLPAINEFTAPAVVEIRSDDSIGDQGDTFRGKVQIGGYRRTYTPSGSDKSIASANNTLDLVA